MYSSKDFVEGWIPVASFSVRTVESLLPLVRDLLAGSGSSAGSSGGGSSSAAASLCSSASAAAALSACSSLSASSSGCCLDERLTGTWQQARSPTGDPAC
jgi:hypothetical protein